MLAVATRAETAGSTGFACPACDSFDGSMVTDSRPADGAIRRRRRRASCGARFTTFEIVAERNPLVLAPQRLGLLSRFRSLTDEIEKMLQRGDDLAPGR